MSTWYYQVGKKRVGPCSRQQIMEQIKNKKILPDTLIQQQGNTDWVAARSLFSFEEEDDDDATYELSGDPKKKRALTEENEAHAVDEVVEDQVPLRESEWEVADYSLNAPIGCLGFLLVISIALSAANIEMSLLGWAPIFGILLGLGGTCTVIFVLSRVTRRLAVEVANSTKCREIDWLFVEEMRVLGFSFRRKDYPIEQGCHLRIKQSSQTSGVFLYSLDLVSAKGKRILVLKTGGSLKHIQEIGDTYSEELAIPMSEKTTGLQDLAIVSKIEIDGFRLEIRKKKHRLALVVDTNKGKKSIPGNIRFAWLGRYSEFVAKRAKVIYKAIPPNVHIAPMIVLRVHPNRSGEPFSISFENDDSLRKAVHFLERETGQQFQWDHTTESFG